MRVENNIDYGVKNKNICKNNIKYCNLKSESDIVSFGMGIKRSNFLINLLEVYYHY